MRRAILIPLAIVLVWSAVTQAADRTSTLPITGQADEAQFHFLRGNRAYQEKRFEDALASYYLSNRLVANRNVQFNIARCLDRLGRYDETFRAWSSLLDQALPDKEQKAVREAIEQLRPHLALLEIETTPPGATIYAGRRDLGALGTTPKNLALRPGLTKIILEREGYRAVELEAEPTQSKQIKLSVALERIYGEIDIRRVPAASEIRRDFLDGEVLRHGPGSVKILPGPLVLFVSAPGYQTERLTVSVLPDSTVPVDVLIAPAVAPTGILVVRSNITGALIRVDGREAGFAPAVIDGVATGLRAVEILAESRQPFRAAVEVKKGERAFVDAYLSHADPEVTAATKSAVASESAPASVSIVTADEIAAFGYATLAEALSAIRGTFTSNDRSYESVGFRGFSPPGDYTNRVLVLVDGHPINDQVTGQGYVGHDFDVDLANVARIEIVRGPGSVLYGTGALFGVINVVTHRAAEGTHGTVNTTAGTMGLISGRATGSGRKGDAELMLSLAGMESDGDHRYVWPASQTRSAPVWAAPQTGGVPITVLGADGEWAAHADIVGRLGPLSLRAGYNDRKKYLPTGAYDTQPVSGTYNHDRRGYAELRFDRAVQGVQIAARAAYDFSWYRGNFINVDPTVTPYENLKAQWATGELRLGLPRFLRQDFTVGVEIIRHLQMQADQPFADNPAVGPDLIFSAYLVDDVHLSDRLNANLGVRFDDYTKSFGTSLNPRFAIVGKPYLRGNTKLFFGSSFRAPSPNERANNPTESLRPESIWSGEIEHSHAVSDDVHVIVAGFANWLSNLMMLVNDPNFGQIYVNDTNRIRSVGAEGEVRWEPGGGTLLSLSVTRQKVERMTSTGTEPFLNAPETMVKARVLLPLVGLALRLGSELVLDSGRHFRQDDPTQPAADNQVDDAVLWNVSFSGEYRAYHLRYFTGIFNLLDVRDARMGFPTSVDYPPSLIPRYGRSMRAGLALTF
jgi:outer membrane receptor for ferrienterochelin and colicin